MNLYYKVVLFIAIFVSKIVKSAMVQEIFTSDFPVTFEVVEVLKIHRDETVPCGFVVDEFVVLIDYSKPMPQIVEPVYPSLKYLEDDDDKSADDDEDEEHDFKEKAFKYDKELEL